MNKKILAMLFIVVTQLLTAQSPAIEWAVCLGGTGTEGAATDFNTSQRSYGLQVLQTPDLGYIVVGNTNANNGYISGVHGQAEDMWVVKTDQVGNFQWQKALGGTGVDSGAAITLTSDGGYVIVGYSTLGNGDVPVSYGSKDTWMVKLSNSGNLVWSKNLGFTGDEKGYSVQQTSDGGYVVAGASNYHTGTSVIGYNTLVIKTDSLGDTQWEKSFGGSGDEVAYSVQQTADGGFILAGSTQSKNNGDVTGNHLYYNSSQGAYLASIDVWIIKLNSLGTLQWQKCLGGSGEDVAYSILQTSDGSYVVAGSSNSVDGDVAGNHGNYDFWVTKIDANGSILWQKSVGGSMSDKAHFIRQSSDGGYVVCGSSFSADGDVIDHHGNVTGNDYWVVKLNPNGNLVWTKSLGGSSGDTAFSLALTQDDGCAVVGSTNSTNGDVTGMHYNSGATDFWLVKLGSVLLNTDDPNMAKNVTFYPNPVKKHLYFSEVLDNVKIISMDGKVIDEKISASELDLSLLIPGVYFVRATTPNGGTVSKKILKE